MKEDSHTVGDDTNASISEDPSNSTAPQNTESNKSKDNIIITNFEWIVYLTDCFIKLYMSLKS